MPGVRILVVSAPLVGHLLPLLPLAGALRDGGHEVLLASGGAAAGVDTGGIELRDVAGGATVGRAAGRVLLTRPLVGLRELTGRAGTGFVGELFGRVNAGMCDELVRLGERWRPDVVLHESLGVAGAVVAARLGVPAVLLENSLWDGAELVAVTGASSAITRARSRLGLDDLPATALTIRTAPPSLVGGPRPGLPMRAVPHDGGGAVPEWLREPGRRVFVSRSTVSGEGDPTAAVVAAAEAVPAEFVLVRAPESVTRKPLPRNVRATGWLPLARVLPGAAGFVHHGGAGDRGPLTARSSGPEPADQGTDVASRSPPATSTP